MASGNRAGVTYEHSSCRILGMNLGDFCSTLAALLWSVSVILMRVSGFSITVVTLTVFNIFMATVIFWCVSIIRRDPDFQYAAQ